MAGFDVCLVRLTYCFVMHMVAETEVRQALKMCKFAINHTKVSSTMTDLYNRTCGESFPLPDDPALLTPELLETAYKTMKKFQNEHKNPCQHPLKPEIEFLVKRVDKTYRSRQKTINGEVVNATIFDKLKSNRKCI